MLYQVHLDWKGLEHTTSVVIGTDCIGSCKSNYYKITTTTAPIGGIATSYLIYKDMFEVTWVFVFILQW